MPDRLVLLFGWGPEEVGRASSLLHIAETASSMNLEVELFLYAEGVVLARAGTVQKMDQELAQKFTRLSKKDNVKIYACSEAAHKRAIGEKDLAPSISIIGYSTFLDMALEAKSVITV